MIFIFLHFFNLLCGLDGKISAIWVIHKKCILRRWKVIPEFRKKYLKNLIGFGLDSCVGFFHIRTTKIENVYVNVLSKNRVVYPILSSRDRQLKICMLFELQIFPRFSPFERGAPFRGAGDEFQMQFCSIKAKSRTSIWLNVKLSRGVVRCETRKL